MVLAAGDALLLTTTAVAAQNGTDLQTEVSLAEAQIRSAASFGLYSTNYNATIIGNPGADPSYTDGLSPVQLAFYSGFIGTGFRVGLDPETGYWLIGWESQGPESQVAIYSLRTSADPSDVVDITLAFLRNYFVGLRPSLLATAAYNGFIDEADFGSTTSLYYEFTIIVSQGADASNYSGALRTALINQGLGYTSDNCRIYRLAIGS